MLCHQNPAPMPSPQQFCSLPVAQCFLCSFPCCGCSKGTGMGTSCWFLFRGDTAACNSHFATSQTSQNNFRTSLAASCIFISYLIKVGHKFNSLKGQRVKKHQIKENSPAKLGPEGYKALFLQMQETWWKVSMPEFDPSVNHRKYSIIYSTKGKTLC